KWNLATTLIAATGATITSFILAWYRGSWTDLAIGIVVFRFVVRLISALLISGALSFFLGNRLAKAGVLKSYPLGADFDELASE
ncbi:MAG: hypothetical protein FWG67_01235, partial [Defluviitaleaceae bacterium]|nr:hypothetical protein [Defluviitaleaceae bacterium]